MKRLITLRGRVSRPVLWALLRTKSEVVRGHANPAPRSRSALLKEHELVRSGICKQLSSSQRGSQLLMCHRSKIDQSSFVNGNYGISFCQPFHVNVYIFAPLKLSVWQSVELTRSGGRNQAGNTSPPSWLLILKQVFRQNFLLYWQRIRKTLRQT